jgi:hypothetical protein
MRQFTIPTCSPDGFGGGYASRQRDVVADAYSTIAILVEASRRLAPAPVTEEDDRYDDGLVHNHAWACSSSH